MHIYIIEVTMRLYFVALCRGLRHLDLRRLTDEEGAREERGRERQRQVQHLKTW